MSLLRADKLGLVLGGRRILHKISFEILSSGGLSVIGPNGAGKSSLFLSLLGEHLYEGQVFFQGELLDPGVKPWKKTRLGIQMIPEGRGTFPSLTVEENLRLALTDESAKKYLDSSWSQFPWLWTRRAQKAGSLSGGEQQILALARALAPRPKLLLLDEPTQGLSPKAIELLLQTLKEIKSRGLSLLINEQNLAFAEALTERYLLLNQGSVVKQGNSSDLSGLNLFDFFGDTRDRGQN